MIRGTLLAVLALLATATPATPAPSAPASPYVVYELVRVKPGGPAYVQVKMETTARQGRGVFAAVHLAPDDTGGYRYERTAIATLSGDTRWRTYGWPSAPPACPAAPVCGDSTDAISIRLTWLLRVGDRDRILVGGMRGVLKISGYPRQWQVRQTTLGMRTVYAEVSDATGIGTFGYYAEHFRSAKAPGGKLGSMAFAEAPCDPAGAGSATFASADGATRRTWTCGPALRARGFGQTRKAGDWSLSGDVVGLHTDPLRLLVLDYPKRP